MRAIGIFINFFIFCTIPSIFCDDIIVEVAQGQLAGIKEKSIADDSVFYSFKGIPYAKPPVGDLRFKAPQEAESWTGVRDASVHGNVCPQFNPISGIYIPGSEDCLFLNVYTPTLNSTASLPVLFYIHGGAFLFGSGDDNLYGSDFLTNKGVVVVTINYRLEALGLLSLGTEAVPGNAALKDQVLALKWVQKNIAKFGGNPKEVTLLGGTAGGASVAYHIISPMSKGLFKRAISMSGAPSCDWAYPYEATKRAFQLGKLLRPNQPEIKNTTELLEFLQSVPYDQLVNVQPRVLAAENVRNVLFKLEYFTPTSEKDYGKNENFITKDPFESLTKEDVNDVEVMFSYNSEESLLIIDLYNASLIQLYNTYPEMFVPDKLSLNILPKVNLQIATKIIDYYFGNKDVTNENIVEFIRYASIASIGYDVQRFLRKISKFTPKSYFFILSYYSRRNAYGSAGEKYGITKTSHFDEVCYIFNCKEAGMGLDKTTNEYAMVQNITTAITNFAKCGNPSPQSSLGITWPEYNTESKHYVDFTNEQLIVAQDADGKDIEFWESIFDFAGIKF